MKWWNGDWRRITVVILSGRDVAAICNTIRGYKSNGKALHYRYWIKSFCWPLDSSWYAGKFFPWFNLCFYLCWTFVCAELVRLGYLINSLQAYWHANVWIFFFFIFSFWVIPEKFYTFPFLSRNPILFLGIWKACLSFNISPSIFAFISKCFPHCS